MDGSDEILETIVIFTAWGWGLLEEGLLKENIKKVSVNIRTENNLFIKLK